MKKLFAGLLFILFIFFFSLFTGCVRDFECEIYQYDQGAWSYYSWDVYSGKNASEAEDNCEADWSSSYDCLNCEPY